MSKSKSTKNTEPKSSFAAQIKIRLSPGERQALNRLIERAEKAVALSKGTISTSSYVKSVLLNHIKQS